VEGSTKQEPCATRVRGDTETGTPAGETPHFIMDCHRCEHRQLVRRGPVCEHHCRFTGVEVPAQDCPLDVGCPLSLSLTTREDRIVARAILLQAHRTGTEQLLLSHYPPLQRERLVALFDVDDQGAVSGAHRAEHEGRLRWLESLQAHV